MKIIVLIATVVALTGSAQAVPVPGEFMNWGREIDQGINSVKQTVLQAMTPKPASPFDEVQRQFDDLNHDQSIIIDDRDTADTIYQKYLYFKNVYPIPFAATCLLMALILSCCCCCCCACCRKPKGSPGAALIYTRMPTATAPSTAAPGYPAPPPKY